jgi:hypothetical protein
LTRFIVVPDIYGLPSNMGWLSENHALDCLALSALSDRPNFTGHDLHSHLFERDGMQAATSRLRGFSGSDLVGIGFSAGGTALWQAVSQGLELQKLVCVSSTRLRFERVSLHIPTHTFWGELDENRPDEEWCHTIPASSHVYDGLAHGFYQDGDGIPARALHSDIKRILDLGQ